MTPGQKAAATRKRNKEAARKAEEEKVDAVVARILRLADDHPRMKTADLIRLAYWQGSNDLLAEMIEKQWEEEQAERARAERAQKRAKKLATQGER